MKKSIRILHVLHENNAEGLSKPLNDLMKALRARSIESDMIFLKEVDPSRQEKSIEPSRKKVLIKKSGWDWLFVRRLNSFLNDDQITIIHTHDMFSLLNLTWPARIFGRTLVHTRHARLPNKVSSWLAAAQHALIACSADVKNDFLKNCRVSADKVHVIYDGIELTRSSSVDPAEAKNKIKTQLGLKEDSLILVNPGRLVPEEDQATLFKTIRKLWQKKVNIELLMLGQGPLKEELMGLSQEFKIKERVKFLGDADVSLKEDAQAICDVAVFSFNKEVYPFAILEAMARGHPVIATKIGSNVEIVSDGETGFLVPCGFPERIESALMRFAANRPLVLKMKESARNKFQEKFTIEKMALEYEKVYKIILGPPQDPVLRRSF